MIMYHMIQKTITSSCHSCGSINIIKNGTNKCGNQQYHCKACGVYRVLEPQEKSAPQVRKQVLQAYRERCSLRGIERIFGVCRLTVMNWLLDEVEQQPSLE